MKRYFDIEAARRDRAGRRRVGTIGFFDGVHRGHVHVLDELAAWARETGEETVVVTFDRHPQAVLGGHPPVPVISLDHRLLLLDRSGVDATLVLPFGPGLAAWPPDRFAREVLVDALGVTRLLMGFDSAFGAGRSGTCEYLREREAELGIAVRRSNVHESDGEQPSSTKIRSLLAEGDLVRAKRLLGRDVSILGPVTSGDGRGRALGFPTANLWIGDDVLVPNGVYHARALRLGRDLAAAARVDPGEARAAVVNIGAAPTVRAGSTERRVEVHILDETADLYGEYLEVSILEKRRDEVRFGSVDELVRAIEADVAARRALG